jgi:multidrug resistance protein
MGLFTRQHSRQPPSTFENYHPTVDIERGVRSDTTPITSPESKDEVPDPNTVWWDGPNDPANPRNWSNTKKYTNVALVSTMSFVMPLASAMLAPGVPQLMEEFHSGSDELASFVVSVYVIGFALGPMVLAPMSEVYGRLPVYYACNVLFTIFSVACAVSSNLGMLIGFRLLAGCVGSAPLSNGGGTIADLIIQEKRGASLSFYAMGLLLGPILGPVAGGYLALAKGWRWNFWVIAIAVSTILKYGRRTSTYH